jgi:hypothetical protein
MKISHGGPTGPAHETFNCSPIPRQIVLIAIATGLALLTPGIAFCEHNSQNAWTAIQRGRKSNRLNGLKSFK